MTKTQAANLIEREFTLKRVIDLNANERFDILQVNFYPGRPGKAYEWPELPELMKYFTENDAWNVIAARKKRLYCITCSVLFFTALRVVGKAKHEVSKVR